MLSVTNTDKNMFNVKVILKGEKYGLKNCLTHMESEPLIEFYDPRYIQGFDKEGQFISRYYLDTLENDRCQTNDLDLQGNVPDWWVTAENVREAVSYAKDRMLE